MSSGPAGGIGGALSLQLNVKQNAAELGAYMRDLQQWSTEVKAKDQALKAGQMVLTKTPVDQRPIRGGASRAPVLLASSASADQARFAEAKQLGNAAFTAGQYDQAVAHYSQCMLLDPTDAISPSNRAQALLKLRRYHEAESDGTRALELDPTHVKSLFRRAQARKELRKYAGAVQDCEAIAKLDATNKPAQALLKETQLLLQKQQAAKAAASQPIVTAKPVTPVVAATTTAAPAAPAGRRMVIQEEEDDSEEEEVPIQKSTTTPSASASTAAAAAPSTLVTAATPSTSSASSATPAKAAAAATPISPSAAAAAAAPAGDSGMRAPKTAYDFDSTFRTIRTHPQQIAEYFRLMPDWKAYAVLLKTALDGNLLKSLALTLTQHLQHELPLSFTILRGLTTVPRFQVARMMLDAADKKVYAQILQTMATAPEAAGATEAEVRQVAKEFGVTL